MSKPLEAHLSGLDDFIKQIPSVNIASNILYSVQEADTVPYLIIWSADATRDLRFNPPFHLIGTCLTEHEFVVHLETYNGIIAQEIYVDILSIEVDNKFIQFIQHFCSGKLHLCRGIERNPTDLFISQHFKNNLAKILIENLQHDIVIRSRKCKFAVTDEEQNSKTNICLECNQLRILNCGSEEQSKDSIQQLLHNSKDQNYSCDVEKHQTIEFWENSFTESQLLKNSSDPKNFFSSIKSKKYLSRKRTERTITPNYSETKSCSVVVRPVPIEIIQKLGGYESLDDGIELVPKVEPDADESGGDEIKQLFGLRKCLRCGELFQGLLIKHLKTTHCKEIIKLESESFIATKVNLKVKATKNCLQCSETFKGNLSFRKHLRENENCKLFFKSKRKIFKKEDLQFDDETQNCDSCDDTLEGLENLKARLNESRSCNQALKSSNKANLKKGPKFKTKTCETCNQEFRGSSNFMKHLKVSERCKEVYKSRNKRPATAANSSYYLNKGEFLCPICGKNYSCPSALDIHMGCMHGVDSDGKTPVEQHVCDICGNSYGHKLRLKEHIFIYHKNGKLKCDQCDKVFHVQNKLVTHQVAYHLKIRPFKCPECDYEASEMSNVYKHCQKHHGYRAKNKDVRIDHEKLQVIRDKLNYNYFGKTAQSAQNKEKS